MSTNRFRKLIDNKTYSQQINVTVNTRLSDIESLIESLRSVMKSHSNVLSQFYNECDKSKCGFCLETDASIDRMMNNLLKDN